MSFEVLQNADLCRWDEPDPRTERRAFLEGWLRYQRHEFVRRLRDLTPEGLVAWSIPPVELSVLGLVRHMTQMEHGYLTWGLGGGDKVFVSTTTTTTQGAPSKQLMMTCIGTSLRSTTRTVR